MRGRPLPVILLTSFLDLLGFGIIIPLLPFVAERTGASPLEVTLLMASYSLMQFLFAGAWGRLSDRIGRRPVLLISVAGSGLALLLFAFSTTYFALLLTRMLHGAMNANIGVAQAALSDISRPEERAKMMGYFGASIGLGFVFGPAIGGMLGAYALDLPALFAAGLAALNLGSAYLLLPETRQVHAGPARPWRILDVELWNRHDAGELRRVLIVVFLAMAAFSGMESVFALWTERRSGWGALENGLLFSYLGVVMVVTQGMLIRPLRARHSERALARIGLIGVAVGLVALALANGLAGLLVATGLLAFFQGILQPNLTSTLSQAAAPGEIGRVLGAGQSVSALGRVVGPVLAGLSFTAWHISAPFLVAAVITLGALAIFALPANGRTSSSTSPEVD